MESVEELRRALEASHAETAALRAAAEGADRAPRGNESGDAGEADSAYRATYDGGYAGTRADGHAGPNARQGANTANFFWGGKNRPVPKFPKNEDEAAMWHLRFRAHLDGMGLGYTLDHAATPVPVKGDQRDLILRYGEQPVQHAQAAWACLLDATAGAAFEERVLSAVTVRDAWCQILSWTGPSSEAETFFLERQLETVPNYGDENPKFFFSRVDQLLTRLRSANIHKTERQIVNILVRNLSDHYEIEKRSRLDSPLLRRQDVEHIVRASWATRKARQLEHRSASGATPNLHALVASGGFQTSRGGYGGPRRGGGRSSGSGRGIQQSWSRGGGNHYANRQQLQQHPRSPSKPLTANFGLGGPFDGGTNAGGWPQEESPPSSNGSVPHCERCAKGTHGQDLQGIEVRRDLFCGQRPSDASLFATNLPRTLYRWRRQWLLAVVPTAVTAMAPTAVVTTATAPIDTAAVLVIVRNRSCDTTAAATVQQSSMSPAPSVALAAEGRLPRWTAREWIAHSIAQL